MRLFCFVAAAVGWFSLVLQYVDGANYASLASTLNYFSFFTILSNIAAASMFSAVAAGARGRPAWLATPGPAAAIALYMSVTGLVYYFVLQSLWHPTGWTFIGDSGLHRVMPILVLVFWLGFVPKGTLGLRDVPPWLIFPALYGAYSLARGPFAGWYPYPFLDVDKHGYGPVLVNVLVLLVVFVVLGAIFVAIDRGLARWRPVAHTAR